jgi:hypothetical protein
MSAVWEIRRLAEKEKRSKPSLAAPGLAALIPIYGLAPFCGALLVGLCAVGAGVCAEGVFESPGSPSTSAEEFKGFVRSPPTISRIVFAEHYSQQYGVYPTKYFEGKWQTNAYLIIEWGTALPEVENQTGSFEFAWAKCGHSSWSVNGFARQLTVRLDSDDQLGSENRRTAATRPSGLVHLDRALNMGIEHARTASIIWERDGFSLSTVEGASRVQSQGQLDVTQGQATGLQLNFKVEQPEFKEPQYFTWHILYDYDRSSPLPFLPRKIRPLFVEKDGSTSPLTELEILSLVTNASPLPVEAFSTNQPFLRGIAQTFYVSKDSTFYLNRTGGVQFVAKAEDPGLLRNIESRRVRVRYFYFPFALVLALAPLWAAWESHKRRERRTGTRTE